MISIPSYKSLISGLSLEILQPKNDHFIETNCFRDVFEMERKLGTQQSSAFFSGELAWRTFDELTSVLTEFAHGATVYALRVMHDGRALLHWRMRGEAVTNYRTVPACFNLAEVLHLDDGIWHIRSSDRLGLCYRSQDRSAMSWASVWPKGSGDTPNPPGPTPAKRIRGAIINEVEHIVTAFEAALPLAIGAHDLSSALRGEAVHPHYANAAPLLEGQEWLREFVTDLAIYLLMKHQSKDFVAVTLHPRKIDPDGTVSPLKLTANCDYRGTPASEIDGLLHAFDSPDCPITLERQFNLEEPDLDDEDIDRMSLKEVLARTAPGRQSPSVATLRREDLTGAKVSSHRALQAWSRISTLLNDHSQGVPQ